MDRSKTGPKFIHKQMAFSTGIRLKRRDIKLLAQDVARMVEIYRRGE